MKHAIVRVTAQLFIDFCKGGPARRVRVVEHALPADATFVRAGHTPDGELCLVVHSDTFAETPEGQPLPTLRPTVFRVSRPRVAAAALS